METDIKGEYEHFRVPKSVKKVLFRLQGTRSSWNINDGEIILFV